MAHVRVPSRSAGRALQAGLSVVEVLVALAIGLVLVAGVAVLIARQSMSRGELDKSHQLIDNGRYAVNTLVDDLQHAGYFGYFALPFSAVTALPDPCDLTAVGIGASQAVPVQGYDAPASVPAPLSACLADTDHVPGTDIVVVRRAEAIGSPGAISTLAAGQVYVQATPVSRITAIGPDPTASAPTVYTLTMKDGVTPAPVRKYVEHIYFVSPCDVYAPGATTCTAGADNGSPIPTLKRLELTTASGVPAFSSVAIAEGIENLQLDYVLDAAGDGTPSAAPTTAPAVADWTNVMGVQVYVLARNLQQSGGYDGSVRTFRLGQAAAVGPFTDAYKRHVFSGNARLLSLSGRKE